MLLKATEDYKLRILYQDNNILRVPVETLLGLIKYLCKPSSWGNIKLSNLEVFL